MTVLRMRTVDDDQNGKVYVNSGQWKWYHGNPTEAFTPGEWTIHRMPINIPRGAVVTAATWTFQVWSKNDAAGSAQLDIYIEPASAPYPLTNDVLIGAAANPDAFPVSPRVRIGGVGVNLSRAGSTPASDYASFSVLAGIQAVIARGDYQPGGYIALLQKCNSETGDTGIEMGDAYIDVTYTVPESETRRVNINTFANHTFDRDTSGWDAGTFFGEFANTTTLFAPDRGMMYIQAGAPEGTKGFQAASGQRVEPGETWMFSGRVWVDTAITTQVQVGFWYTGGYMTIIPRAEWVNFVSEPITFAGSEIARPHVKTDDPAPSGSRIYCDEFCMTRVSSAFKTPAFTGNTPDKFNADYKFTESSGHGQSVRESRARSGIHTGGSMKNREGWVKRSDGLWVRADKQKI